MDLATLLSNNMQSSSMPYINVDDLETVSAQYGSLQTHGMANENTPLSTSCKNYCLLCKQFTNKKDQRDQGPRRHILHKHIEKPSFLCPHCDYASKFHKHHIKKHIRDTHPGKDETVIVRDCEEELKKWYKECFGIEGTNARPGPRTRREKTEFEAKCASLDTPGSAYSSGVDSSILGTPGSSSRPSLHFPLAGSSQFQASPLVSNSFSSLLFTNPFLTPASSSSNSSFSTASSSDSANSSFSAPFSGLPIGSPLSPQLHLFLLQTLLNNNSNRLPTNFTESPEAPPNTSVTTSNQDSSKPAFFVDNLLS